MRRRIATCCATAFQRSIVFGRSTTRIAARVASAVLATPASCTLRGRGGRRSACRSWSIRIGFCRAECRARATLGWAGRGAVAFLSETLAPARRWARKSMSTAGRSGLGRWSWTWQIEVAYSKGPRPGRRGAPTAAETLLGGAYSARPTGSLPRRPPERFLGRWRFRAKNLLLVQPLNWHLWRPLGKSVT